MPKLMQTLKTIMMIMIIIIVIVLIVSLIIVIRATIIIMKVQNNSLNTAPNKPAQTDHDVLSIS